jgi:DNA-binding NarL/FixJ family response regulator
MKSYIDHNRIRISIIDDDPYLLQILCSAIKHKFGSDVRAYSNAYRFLEEYTRWKPDIIFLDYQLNIQEDNNLNGIELISLLMKMDSTQKIIFMSTDDNIEFLLEGISIGATGYIFKNSYTAHSIINYINRAF